VIAVLDAASEEVSHADAECVVTKLRPTL
jgi:hypothetical protein